ncbi:MAG TPA: NAD(P)H-hydrate dehydratase [Mariprofundaceae bacterium]|nr:NAD(P)H-hydrate dehydratase [Mariprofundaceae bacterium]
MANIRILTAAQMRWADRKTIEGGISSFDLMDRAGQAIAGRMLDCLPDFGRILIVTGPGNNGGDGFAAARCLRMRRVPVTVVTLFPVEQMTGESLMHVDKAREAGVKIREACSKECLDELDRWLARSVMVLDAIFGTGLARPLEGHVAEAVSRINAWERPVFSIDIASGLDADNGAALGVAIRADWTLPIAACKWGHWLGEGRDCSGQVLEAAQIGISDETLCEALRAEGNGLRCASVIDEDVLNQAWPPRPRISHKGDYGHVWVFGGSVGYTGAPKLAARGAFAAGAGLVSIVCPDDVWSVVAAGSLEVMAHPESSAPWQMPGSNVGVIVAGPGWGTKREQCLSQLLATDRVLVLDADALNMIAKDEGLQQMVAQRKALTILTPHPGEAARLLGESVQKIQADRKHFLIALTRRYQSWVVLKGNETLVGSPDDEVFLSPFGSPQMAVAGCGDVLAGVIAAQLVMAEGRKEKGSRSTEIGITAAVALHGLAGQERGWHLAGELAGCIAGLRQEVERQD